MPDVFRNVILKLNEIGAFNFLFPFMLTSAIFYGLLRKSKIFGADSDRNVALNGVIALTAAFMVWAFPVINGVDIQAHLSAFFMQGMVVMLVLMVGLMIAGMIFPENISEKLWEIWKGRSTPTTIFLIAIIVGIVVFITSGLVSLFLTPDMLAVIPSDILLTLGLVLVMIIPLIWIATPGK
ncbi:MAG: hypothetical protein KQA41_00235 [Candidatus Aenigmarchaeota archaeon]|nr:hypothetical protein [Candidatus Aenigmarchaeota archaeon]MBU5688644.1 hypothetical protein [Candidatus Aenigmarchaeota archaeon]